MSEQKRVNGIDVDQLDQCMDDVSCDPQVAQYTFHAKNLWDDGSRCHTIIRDFQAGGQEDHSRQRAHVLEADEPTGLLGSDQAANATEALLHALGACLNASFIYHAASQGIEIDQLEFDLHGDLDLRGFLGVNESVPSNFQQIRVTCRVKSNAPAEKLEELFEYAQKRSPVFNSVTRPIPVDVKLQIEKPVGVGHQG